MLLRASKWFAVSLTASAYYCSQSDFVLLTDAYESSSHLLSVQSFSTADEYLGAIAARMSAIVSVADWRTSYPCALCFEVYIRSVYSCESSLCTVPQLFELKTKLSECAMSSSLDITVTDVPRITTTAPPTTSSRANSLFSTSSGHTYCSQSDYVSLRDSIQQVLGELLITYTSTVEKYLEDALGRLSKALGVVDLQAVYPCFPCVEIYIRASFDCRFMTTCSISERFQLRAEFDNCALDPHPSGSSTVNPSTTARDFTYGTVDDGYYPFPIQTTTAKSGPNTATWTSFLIPLILRITY